MLDFVLNFLYPPVCVICGKLDQNWCCEKCRKRVEKYERFKLISKRENIEDFLYKRKVNNYENNNIYIKIYFDELLYCYEYKNLIRKLLLNYKFSDCSYIYNFFGNVILNNKKINEIFGNYDIMIPVPMDKNKMSKRGYNQTELIANYINKSLDKTLEINNNILFKIKPTKTQSTLTSNERTKNVEGAFEVRNKELKNKNIIIFDDIVTTGSTVNEISRILKIEGVGKILVLAIAKD